MNSITRFLSDLNDRHERLKKFVHEGMKYPLPKWGRVVMGTVYFSIPMVVGYNIMLWSERKALENLGARGELIAEVDKPTGSVYGDTRIVNGKEERVGGPQGWGGGVRLIANDHATEKWNEENFLRYMARLEKEKKAQEQQRGI